MTLHPSRPRPLLRRAALAVAALALAACASDGDEPPDNPFKGPRTERELRLEADGLYKLARRSLDQADYQGALIRYGQIQKYGKERGDVGNKLGDVPYSKFAEMLGGYGEEVREASQIRPALERARASGKASLINVWIDPDAYAPGTMNQTMYK